MLLNNHQPNTTRTGVGICDYPTITLDLLPTGNNTLDCTSSWHTNIVVVRYPDDHTDTIIPVPAFTNNNHRWPSQQHVFGIVFIRRTVRPTGHSHFTTHCCRYVTCWQPWHANKPSSRLSYRNLTMNSLVIML